MKKRKHFRRILAVFLAVSLMLTMLPTISFAAESTCQVENLQTEYLTNPLGIDTAIPRLSWNIQSSARGQEQTAYQIIVSTDESNAQNGIGDVWDSQKVESDQNYHVEYGGPALNSMTRYYWAVRIWDKDGVASDFSDPAFFETAMLKKSDWKAQWITLQEETYYPSATIDLETTEARYVRLNVTELGIPVENDNSRLQLAEVEIYDAETGDNIALGANVTSNATFVNATWAPEYCVDGVLDSSGTNQGYTSDAFSDPNTNVWLCLDLGEVRSIDKVVLYARNDYKSVDGDKVPNFPIDYAIETAVEADAYQTVYSVVDAPVPEYRNDEKALPIFAKSFTVDKPVQSARVYASGLGLFEMTVNGQKATDALFEPGETNFDKTAFYVTYDITDKLVLGENAVGVALGKGFYYNPASPGRYNRSPKIWGPLMMLAQIEITYTDGNRQTIVSDGSWKSAKGPVVDAVWLGGEDYDARREKTGFDQPGYDYSGWESATIVTELPFETLKAKMYPSLKVVEEVPCVEVKPLSNGDYVIDFGMNFAGIYEFTASLPEGTKVEFWPGEMLNEDGSVSQGSTGSPIFDTYTFKGSDSETYTPKFVYHGFRYLQVKGLTKAPAPSMFNGMIVRCDNEQVGSFETSSPEINQIHELITRSISDNMYNVLTDCPHREKLGWLEVTQLLYSSISNNFDIAAWMQKISNDMMDAQKDYGSIPSIVPPLTVGHAEHALRPGPDDTPNDPTWCGANILDPWYSYLTYGNVGQLETAYDSMDFYMDYLTSLVVKSDTPYILEVEDLNRNLGDWGQFEGTSETFVVTCTYYQLCDIMRQISELTGQSEKAQQYRDLASQVKTAINETFLNRDTQSYDTGSQTANALPLYLDIVPPEYEEGVLANLVASVQARDYHFTSGEAGLKPLLYTLSDHGYADLAYKMMTNKTMPSYYYFVTIGKTSLPESWDGGASQNHCMLGHGEGWLYEYLGGIRNAGVGYEENIIAPYIPDDLTSVDVSTMTRFGTIRSAWTREGNQVTMQVDIPVGTTSTIQIPAMDAEVVTESGKPLSEVDGILSFEYVDGYMIVKAGSGSYTFASEKPETLDKTALQSALSSAKEIDSRNVLSGYDALQEAIDNADVVLETAKRQVQIDEALEALNIAVNNLIYKENLAVGKTAEASSSVENSSWSIQKLTDGDRENWINAGEQGGGYTSMSDEFEQHSETVTIDLESSQRFSWFDIYPRKFSGLMYTFPQDFKIEVSENGEDWITVVAEKDYPLTNYAKQSFSFEAVTARYIRFTAETLRSNPNDEGRYRLQMAEFEVYDDTTDCFIEAPGQAYANEKFVVTVTTSPSIDKLALFNEYGLKLGIRSQNISYDQQGNKVWTITTSIGTVGTDRQISVYGSWKEGPYEALGSFTLNVASIPPVIHSVDMPEQAKVNVPITIPVVTDTTVNRIAIENEYGLAMGIVHSNYQDIGGQRVWTVQIKIGTAGTRSFRLFGINRYGVRSEAYQTNPVQVFYF